jgi:hypothetical protein
MDGKCIDIQVLGGKWGEADLPAGDGFMPFFALMPFSPANAKKCRQPKSGGGQKPEGAHLRIVRHLLCLFAGIHPVQQNPEFASFHLQMRELHSPLRAKPIWAILALFRQQQPN